MSVKLYPNRTTEGQGTNQIEFEWGKNTTRRNQTKTYFVSEGGLNRLYVTQQYVALKNEYNGASSRSISPTSSTQTVTFSGKANGKYLKIVKGVSTVTVACTVGAQSIGETATQISTYEGGSDEYTYNITLTVPANAAEGSQSVTVTTSDSASFPTASSISKNFTLTITSEEIEDVAIQGVTISIDSSDESATNWIRVGEDRPFIATITPSNATIDSVVWSSTNNFFSIAQNQSDPLKCVITGVTQGEYLGGDRLTVTVTDTLGNTVTDWFGVMIKAPGSITFPNAPVTIASYAESAQTEIVLYNIDTSKGFTITQSEGTESWVLGDFSVDYNNTPNTVSIGSILPNHSTPSGRTSVITVNATDVSGDPVTSSFNLTQEYNTQAICTEMRLSGPSTISNSSNTAKYTVSYIPDYTTQKTCSWSLTYNDGSAVPTSVAYLSGVTNNDANVIVGSGADGTQLKLTVSNSAASSTATPQSIVITATYYEAPSVVVTGFTGTEVQLTYYDESDSTPTVTFIHSLPAAQTPVVTDRTVIESASLVPVSGTSSTYTLTSVVNPNTATGAVARDGWVDIYAFSEDEVALNPVRVQFHQAGAPVTESYLEIVKTTSGKPSITSVGSTIKLNFSLIWHNMATSEVSFVAPNYTVNVYENASDQAPSYTFTEEGIGTDVTVAAASTRTVDYSRTLSGASMILLEAEKFTLVVSS
jgi:hypothetical protein